MNRRNLLIALLFASIAFALFMFKGRVNRREATFYPMGGLPFTVIVYGRGSSEFKDDMRAVINKVEELEKVYSKFLKESELVHFNKVASKGIVETSAQLATVLSRAKYWCDETDGAFDVTIQPLVDLWKKSAEENRIPSSEELVDAVSRVGCDRLLTLGNAEFRMTKTGMKIDLGGLAKGAIVDAVKRLLIYRGVEEGLVIAGGDGIAFGNRQFKFGIQDPRVEKSNSIIGAANIKKKAIVTSGNYRRYFTIYGKKYSHIIDPKSGEPADALISVTVIGDNAMDADALATALSVMGKKRAIQWLKTHPEFNAIMIEKGTGENFKVLVSNKISSDLQLADNWKNNVIVF